jgi:hypothetical protein
VINASSVEGALQAASAPIDSRQIVRCSNKAMSGNSGVRVAKKERVVSVLQRRPVGPAHGKLPGLDCAAESCNFVNANDSY